MPRDVGFRTRHELALEMLDEVGQLLPHAWIAGDDEMSPFPMETSYTWEAIDDSSTRMTLRNRGRPSGFSALMARFMPLMVRRANKQDLARLKNLLENSQSVSVPNER